MTQPQLCKVPAGLAKYRLMAQPKRKGADSWVKKLVGHWMKMVCQVYTPQQADWRIGEDLYLLQDETAKLLYGPGPWDKIDYVPGSRPMLEWALQEKIKLDRKWPDERKALAITRYSRDICAGRQPPDNDLFLGGWEEEVILKTSTYCNEQSRVMIRLAQIAGLPARYIGHVSGNHGTVEMKVNGKWAHFDIRGMYYYKADGTLASMWDLKQDPSLVECQSAKTEKDILPQSKGHVMTRTQTFPKAITGIAPYRFTDYDWSSYLWTFQTDELVKRLKPLREAWVKMLAKFHGGREFTSAGR